MKKILKVTSILGIATLVRILAGALRAKFLAWQIGPAGVGLVGQALMYSMFTIQLCTLNMGMGITKNISEALSQREDNRIPLVVNTAGMLQFIVAILFIAFVLPFSRTLTRLVFSDYKYWGYFMGITLVTPFALYLVGMADPILFAYRKITDYTRLMILYTLIGLVLVFVLVPFYKIEGMFAQIVIISVVGFFLSYYFIRKKLSIEPKLNFSFIRDIQMRLMSFQLFQYGLISFLPGITSMCVLLYLRSLLIRQFGIEANGYYHVAYALSAYYLPFVTNGIWGHFYPQMCALRARDDINREINQFVKFTLFISTAVAACLIIFRRYIILVLYSSQFLKAYELLAIQGVGDIFFILIYMFCASLMARRKFKDVVLIQVFGYNLSLLVLYLILTRFSDFNFRSLNMAIAFTNFAFVIVHLLYHKRDTGFLLTRENVCLFLKSVAFLGFIYCIPDINVLTVMLKIVISLVWLTVAIRKDEAKSFIQLIAQTFARKR